MPIELAERLFRVDGDAGEIPESADIKIADNRLRRASELEPGEQIVDCSFKIVVVKESTWEIATFIELKDDAEIDAFVDMSLLPDESERQKKFQELFGSKELVYQLIDVEILDTNGGYHSFIHCCHFPDEHEIAYPEIGLVHSTP